MPPESLGYTVKDSDVPDSLSFQYKPAETEQIMDGQVVQIISTVGELLTFDKNRTSLSAMIDLPENRRADFVVKAVWKYQDNKQQP